MSAKTRLYIKAGLAGAAMMIGGPALVWYVTPTEEELFKRFNPELQRRSLENRQKTQEDFDQFVTKLKEYSKSNKPIWTVVAEEEARRRGVALEEQRRSAVASKIPKEEIWK